MILTYIIKFDYSIKYLRICMHMPLYILYIYIYIDLTLADLDNFF